MGKSVKEIVFTNSATHKKEPFVPSRAGHVSFYSCGPTVYGHIHVGNLRAALVSDLFYRFLKSCGYSVTFVRNYTDVDDKIIQRAAKENKTSLEISEFYIKEVEKDYAAAGMLEPTQKVKVTEHMPEIIRMIERILANGHAYVNSGEVLFSVRSFENYGKLSNRNLDELQAGSRVEPGSYKKDPLDFSLWKPAKPGEPSWESPWGAGRPGWHIECSAMAEKWLGDQLDLHHGGEDLIFPHHENEIAQSEAASGKHPYVKYWVHNGFLNINSEKMSKSLGNFLTAREFLTQFGSEVARMLLLGSHYRSIIDFSPETLDQALGALQRIYEAKRTAIEIQKNRNLGTDLMADAAWGQFVADVEQAKQDFSAAMANDLNTPEALGSVFTLVREFNRLTANERYRNVPTAVMGAGQWIDFLETDVGGILGIGRREPGALLADLDRIRQERIQAQSAVTGIQAMDPTEIAAKIQARLDARKAKDFARADAIRDELLKAGVVIKDGPQGTVWSYQ